MATEAPDPQTFSSWEDAFAYPVPTVRSLETNLRSRINDNKDKVRSLVGSGYRDLLGTADRIITMNEDMQKLEDVINAIGQRSNSRLAGRMATNYDQLAKHRRDATTPKRRAAAELALLQPCLSVCQRLVREPEGDLLLAARLVLLSRLLQQSATKSSAHPDHKSCRAKVGAQRSRLLHRIDLRLAQPDIPRAQLLDLLLAHALVTSSSLADVARHLLRVRQAAIASLMEKLSSVDAAQKPSSKTKTSHLISALALLFTTISQMHAMFPNRMADTIARATAPRLLQAEALRDVLAFDLDVYERWLSPDVQGYTAWLRRDDLDAGALKIMLGKWSDDEVTAIVQGLQTALAGMSSAAAVAKLREAVLSYILTTVVTNGFDRKPLVDTVRSLCLDRLQAITSTRINTIKSKVRTALGASAPSPTTGSLWDPALGETDLARGAVAFRATLAARSKGEDARLRSLESAVVRWTEVLDNTRATVKSMRHTRWAEDADLDEDGNGDDRGADDDEATATSTATAREQREQRATFQSALGRQDPDTLAQHVQSQSQRALEGCLSLLEDASRQLRDDDRTQAVYLVRVLRVVSRAMRAQHQLSPAAPSEHSWAGTESAARVSALAASLHGTIATSIASELDRSSGITEDGNKGSRVLGLFPSTGRQSRVATALWQGSPPLPVQVSSGTYRFVRDAARLMNAVGGDVWSAAAVDAVKARLAELVATGVGRALNAADAVSKAADGNAGGSGEHNRAGVMSEGNDHGGVNGQAKADGGEAAVERAEMAHKPPTARREAGSNEEDSTAAARTKTGELLKEILFDVLYLEQILSLSSKMSKPAMADDKGEENSALAKATAEVRTKLDLQEADVERLGKSALAYHRRSYLMFGVLCPS